MRVWEHPCLAGYKGKSVRRWGSQLCSFPWGISTALCLAPPQQTHQQIFVSILDDCLRSSLNQACGCGQVVIRTVPGTRLWQTYMGTFSFKGKARWQVRSYALSGSRRSGQEESMHCTSFQADHVPVPQEQTGPPL